MFVGRRLWVCFLCQPRIKVANQEAASKRSRPPPNVGSPPCDLPFCSQPVNVPKIECMFRLRSSCAVLISDDRFQSSCDPNTHTQLSPGLQNNNHLINPSIHSSNSRSPIWTELGQAAQYENSRSAETDRTNIRFPDLGQFPSPSAFQIRVYSTSSHGCRLQ
jgi:hypothetical protein